MATGRKSRSKTAEVSFAVSAEDAALIRRIVDRFIALRRDHDIDTPASLRMTLCMDLEACHANGTPLRLAAMLAGRDFDLAHDVAGIHCHIDRRTGRLDGHFLPRYADLGRAGR